VKEVLLREGVDSRYGARHLKRSIERLLVMPMSNLVASGQVGVGDLIYADLDHNGSEISFARRSSAMTIDNSFLTEPSLAEFGASLHAAPLSQLAAALVRWLILLLHRIFSGRDLATVVTWHIFSLSLSNF